MDQSELSKIIATLKIAYPGHFKNLKSTDIVAMVNLYGNQLKGYSYGVVNKAINNIISSSKFMPSISDIRDECYLCIERYEMDLLKKMYDDGYFHNGVEKLDNDHASRNYEKANMWLCKGIIPEWLVKDMMKYGYKPMIKYGERPTLKQQEQPLLLGE